jgi:pyridoxamine 5'-phosphate oxidase
MDITDCVKFANENPVTYIATTDGEQPRVRAFAMWFADNSGFYYHTGSAKAVCRQLKKNPNVELCFYKPGEAAGTMMRVAGKVEFIDDTALMDRLFQDRPWMKDITKVSPDVKIAMFRVAHGEAYFWTMADNMREHVAPHIKF